MDKNALAKFHRDNIINAAENLFAANGIEKTTMDDISKTAGYSKTTVYAYFESKDEICEEITLKSFVCYKDMLLEAIKKGEDFEGKYFNVCRAFADFQEKCPLYFELFTRYVNLERKDIYEVGEEINRIIYEIEPDILTPQIVAVLSISLSGILQVAAQKEQYLEKEIGMNKQDFLDYSFEYLLKGIKQ